MVPALFAFLKILLERSLQKTYHIYAEDAVFHDPIGIASGVTSIRAQFNGLAKVSSTLYTLFFYLLTSVNQLFPRADIPKFRVLENPPTVTQSTIHIDQVWPLQ